MVSPTKLRYWLGKSVYGILDMAVAYKLLPPRFPVGVHFEYDLRRFLGVPVNEIVDGGANVGGTALRLVRYFKEATIHAFEPVSTTFHRLEERTKMHPQILRRQLALGEQEMDLTITVAHESELNSLLNTSNPSEAADCETVHVVCLDQYAKTQRLQKIDLLKLDLEGYELLALRGACELLKNGSIRAVYAECGFLGPDRYKSSFGEMNEFLHTYGFIFSGFYQTYRWGPHKRWMGFSNGLWLLA